MRHLKSLIFYINSMLTNSHQKRLDSIIVVMGMISGVKSELSIITLIPKWNNILCNPRIYQNLCVLCITCV